MLLNLLGNAVKYTGAGGIVSMRITEKAGAPEGYANYEFYIKDTGIGMSKEFVEIIPTHDCLMSTQYSFFSG